MGGTRWGHVGSPQALAPCQAYSDQSQDPWPCGSLGAGTAGSLVGPGASPQGCAGPEFHSDTWWPWLEQRRLGWASPPPFWAVGCACPSEERLRKGVVDCVLTEGLEACTLTGETKPHARLCALSW